MSIIVYLTIGVIVVGIWNYFFPFSDPNHGEESLVILLVVMVWPPVALIGGTMLAGEGLRKLYETLPTREDRDD